MIYFSFIAHFYFNDSSNTVIIFLSFLYLMINFISGHMIWMHPFSMVILMFLLQWHVFQIIFASHWNCRMHWTRFPVFLIGSVEDSRLYCQSMNWSSSLWTWKEAFIATAEQRGWFECEKNHRPKVSHFHPSGREMFLCDCRAGESIQNTKRKKRLHHVPHFSDRNRRSNAKSWRPIRRTYSAQ